VDVTLRPYNVGTDAPRVAEIVSATRPEPVTADDVRDWERQRPAGQVAHRMVAVDDAGVVVGRAVASHESWEPAGHFWVAVMVDPAVRRRGVGTLLYQDALCVAGEQGAAELEAEVRDGDPASLAFAQHRGFEVSRHIFESTLDLTRFDESRFGGVVAAGETNGFRFFTLADAGDTLKARRKLYELNRSTAMDVPGRHTPFAPFDAFRAQVFDASWFRADAQIVAAHASDPERWVGMAALGYFEKQVWDVEGGAPRTVRHMYHMMTGVERDYRGRGLATALKLLAVRCARRYGAAYLRTNNDSQNAPMLAVNRTLGFVPEPGKYLLVCRPAGTVSAGAEAAS
jgi:GNAT superfamily N-acetyltransferase